MSTPPVVIGIPTFRRPEMLAKLLTSLRPEIEGREVVVIVADNDPGPITEHVLAETCVEAFYVPVHEPGISAVRNAIIRTALGFEAPWEWLIMLDDDGYVESGWLDSLIDGAERFDADVAGGRVEGSLPGDASLLARNSMFAGRPRHPDGLVEMLNGAQNIAIARRLIERLEDPWFSPELGLTGGEDHYFFRSLRAEGARLAWCDAAVVVEPTPAERLRASAILRRAFRSNLITAQNDVEILGRAAVAEGVRRGWRITARNFVASLVRRDFARLIRTGLDVVGLAGRMTGIRRSGRPTKSHGDY